jgi:hypothetical protein
MLQPELQPALPTSDELPGSDDTPVNNSEDRNLLPNVLLFLLASPWAIAT